MKKEFIDKLMEASSEYDKEVKKPFPHGVIRKPGASLARTFATGTTWRVHIHSIDAPVPEEIFKVLDLHHQAGNKPGFIGWIAGQQTSGEKGVLFVTEAQSDLLQKTSEFMDPEKYQANIQRQMAQAGQGYSDAYNQLVQLYKEFKGSSAGYPLQQQLGFQQQMGDLEDQLNRLEKRRWSDYKSGKLREPKYPSFAEYRNKVENYYKKWLHAFYNAAVDYAKDQGLHYIFIASSDKVFREWHDYHREQTREIMDRAYDSIAQKLGMTHLSPREVEYASKKFNLNLGPVGGKQSWWIGKTAAMPTLENINTIINRLLEEIEPPEQWRSHLNTFVRVFARNQNLNPNDQWDFNEIFGFWIDEVQPELKDQDGFKQEVIGYVMTKWGVDVSDRWGEDEYLTTEPEPEVSTTELPGPDEVDWDAFLDTL